MADKRISQLIERVTIANNDVLPIVASGATTTNKVTVSTLQDWMQSNLDVGVTSIGITIGTSGTNINVTGSPVTTSGNITINIPTASATNRGVLSSTDWTTFNNKLSSVGLTMPSAFTVTNSPLTANGTIAVTGAGTVSQYIRGDGSLADFPEAGGGGASVSYYLNGSVSQGTIGGVAYLEMNKNPVLGAGTNFSINANGYIASFITDAGDPGLLEIPGGNWNFETYFQASSGGGTPSFYVELYKVNSGGTATLIASNSSNPELIAFGTTTTAYFSSLAVPTTTLALTDRLALRYYVTHSGRTITLHTENSNLCQIITTFTTGLTALNGLTAQVQNFATGTSGTDFAISSAGSTHTFNLPDASATARGVVTTGSQTIAGIKTFSSNMNADGGVRLPAAGTALPTFVNNISGSGLSSSGSNGFGFNNANNFYFSGSDKGGSVFVVNNTATRNYTFQDTSGVIALTSNIPTNPVGGSGTINQIPKYTSSTTTIGNSNISDNGSDVVIASRTGISLSGQSILFTPNLGGTTNRIETTGGLPLALVTSGSSITLAAGGTTPQITLASTGAVTLTGALNGTSASFTSSGGSVSISNASDIWYNLTRGSSITNIGIDATGTFYNTNTNHRFLTNSGSTTALTLSSTGAATFSSSVTATGLQAKGSTLNNGNNIKFLRADNTEMGYIGWSNENTNNSTWLFKSSNGNPIAFSSDASTNALTLATSGAATFSNSVTAANLTVGSATVGGQVKLDYGANVASRSWRLVSDAFNFGDFSIQQSTTQTGSTYSDRLLISATGNVGIGTASPSSILNLFSSSCTLTLDDSGNGTSKISFRPQAASYAERGSIAINYQTGELSHNSGVAGNSYYQTFFTNGTERMRITSSGNVGIGTSSPTAYTGYTTLHVGSATSRGMLKFGNAASLDGPEIYTNTNSDIYFNTNSVNNRIFISGSNGNVGIGTASPNRLTEIVSSSGGVLGVSTSANSSSILYGRIAMYSTAGSNSYIDYGGEIRSYSGAGIDQSDLRFYTAGGSVSTERMRITSGGNVGIGTNNPNGGRLHIADSGADNTGLYINNNTFGHFFTKFSYQGSVVGSISYNGSNTVYTTTSDYRLKENVNPVESALSKLSQLKPCTFNFKSNPDEEVMGFIAHEVQEVIPQAVIGQKDEVRIEQVEISPAELDEEGNVITEAVIQEKEVPVYQGIDHSILVPLLVAAIQEQQEQIKSLTEQVEALKSQING